MEELGITPEIGAVMLRCEKCKKSSSHIYDGFCSDCLSVLLDESERDLVVSACEKAHLREAQLIEQQIKHNLFGSK